MPPNPTPKPFRGWAVYTDNGIVPWTLSPWKTDAITAWMFDFRQKFGQDESFETSQERIPTTCRRVVVVAEEGE